jgi:type I restriction enzyme S subunit
MNSRTQYQLKDLCTKITDGSHFSPKDKVDGLPMFSVKDMYENGFDYSRVKKISEEDFNSLVKQGCQPVIDDIIIAKDGSVLKHIFRIKEKPDYVLLSSIAILRPNTKIINPNYLVYSLKNPNITEHILTNFVSGSGVPRIVLKDFKAVVISIPPLPEQTAIAEVLSSLDDKIDLLHIQNKTLENLAETLFRKWFVEDAEESWEEKSLVDIAEYLNGLALQKFPAKGINELNVIKIREMKQGISENTDKCSNEIPSKYIIQNGDILFSWSGSLEVVIWYDGEGALNQHLFKVSSDKYPKWFYYLATKHHLENFKMIAESKSTTMGHIQREHLREATIQIPPKEIFAEYDNKIAPLIEKRIKNNSQIKTLTKLRDTLLPKLMSGEVRIDI